MNRREFITLRSDAGDPAWGWMSLSWLAVVIGCLYILSAKLSLSLLTPDGVAVFWPAAGVAAGALIAFGPRARWAVVAGTMVATSVANLLGDRNLLSSIVFAVCNAGEALLAAALIERFFSSPFNLDRLRHVLGLLGAAIIATAVSGIGGTLGFALFHSPTAPLLVTWQNWFASDALGIITIAPLLIGLASATREPPGRNETIEGLAALASLIVMSVIVIALPPEPWTTVVPIALLFPVLLWIAARCRPVFAAAAAFIVTLAIVWTTTIGIGHFGDPGLPMADRVLAARPQFLTAYRLHMHRTIKPRPHHLRYAARIVAVRLVDLRLQHRLHVPRLNADHRQSCFSESAEQPLRQRSSFQPNSLEMVGEVLQHRQQRFRFARHL